MSAWAKMMAKPLGLVTEQPLGSVTEQPLGSVTEQPLDSVTEQPLDSVWGSVSAQAMVGGQGRQPCTNDCSL